MVEREGGGEYKVVVEYHVYGTSALYLQIHCCLAIISESSNSRLRKKEGSTNLELLIKPRINTLYSSANRAR